MNTDSEIEKKINRKKLLINILLFAAFPIICLVFALIGKWLIFGIVLLIYLAVFVYIKLENIYLIQTGYFDKKGELQKTLKPAYKAYKIKNSTIDTANIFIYMLLKAGKYDKALEITEDNRNRYMTEDQYIAFSSNEALALWKTGKTEQSVALFDKIASKFESTSLYVSYGTVLTYSDDLNKALQVNKKAYEYNSGSKGIKDNLAYTYFLIGDTDRARRMYDELLSEPLNFPEAYYNAALVYCSQGDYDEGVRLMKSALTKQFNGLTAVTKEEISEKIDYLNRGQGALV
ncbi:MAG TPA: tetratricopeptide repeat protein [Clostridia bacterium]|jgi:tetratricopeptide (TPR) repeat protein|nr:tetratricopeptide repeat protein [Clostridiaceae bacterium]HOF26662.1 tetratricopeptide repeat protein [Clostridia bacterium]HOM34161.1 tetratricopeptide repeat protein [Clostridia bacterium]HOR89826.1 tetratricopeptide repeat protein [Clostridia bacterium]HOT71221.1 tetratricopeptide repeat protein [Clostridia bacterium]